MFFSQKYENIISIFSLFFLKSIKIFAKEEKREKKNRAAMKEKSSVTKNTVFFTKTWRTFNCYVTYPFF